MSTSGQLRLSDVRAVFRLVSDCRDLGDDPVAWRSHALAGVCRLVGGNAANGGEILWPGRGDSFRITLPTVHGFSPKELALYNEFMREFGPSDPLIQGALRDMGGAFATRPRTELIDERTWMKAPHYTLYREARQRFDLFSVSEIEGTDSIEAIILHRPIGDRDFRVRECRMMGLLHEELGRLIGTVLTTAQGSPIHGLSPRLRKALDGLLEGDGEKQLAARLGLSRATVHEYVTELYRRFGVSSRAELLARFVRRPRLDF